MTALSDSELNRTLAELCGWKHVGRRATIAPDFLTGYPPTASGLCHMVPHFTTDLNAVARVEAGLTEEQAETYYQHVCAIGQTMDSYPMAEYTIHASAKQRTIALIECLK